MSLGQIALEGRALAMSWAVSAANKGRRQATGDGYLIARSDERVLIAVVDGSGSGEDAERAAQDCLEELGTTCLSLALAGAFDACHRRLRGTRGAALALVEITLADPLVLTWASVGDVDGQLLRHNPPARRQQFGLVQSQGTLGFAYDSVYPQSHPLALGDMLLITTDGISRDYRDQSSAGLSPADLTRATVDRFGRPNDDQLALALAIVALS